MALLAFVIVLTLNTAANPPMAIAANAAPPKFEDLLHRIASFAPDECSARVASASPHADVTRLETQLFQTVKVLVANRLNDPSQAVSSNVRSRAISALREVEQSSAQIDKSWPNEDRFHFEVLVLPPAILVKMTYRDQTSFVLFGSYYLSKYGAVDPGTRWREVDLLDPNDLSNEVDLFPLHRGPSGRVRFLAKVSTHGCAGSFGEAHYGYEWSPDAGQLATEIIKIEGAEGLDDAASTQVGRLSTTGRTIQLPYCFFSAVDTWDNPTLCAADSFDLSGDEALFDGRIYNRPDLVTVARAIQYAQARDYVAARGYCASDIVAKQLVRQVPAYLFADTLDTIKAGPARESVLIADGMVRFDLIEHRSRWLIKKIKIALDSP